MAYFNHAFNKLFLGTGESYNDLQLPVGLVSTNEGYVNTEHSIPTYGLNQLHDYAKNDAGYYKSGYFGVFYSTGANANKSWTATDNCCSIYFAGSAIYSSDKIGPFAGGYQETNKSKVINPRYVSRFYTVAPCAPQNEVLHVGSTYWTAGGGIDSVAVNAGGTTYTDGDILPLTGSVAGTGALVQVTCAVSPGPVTGVTLIAPGKGYDVAESPLTIDGGTGDATIDITVTQANTDPVTGSGGESCCKPFLCGETYNLRLDIRE